MEELYSIWLQIEQLFTNLFVSPDWRNLLDILIVAALIYQIIKMFLHTRADSVLKGVAVVLLFMWVSDVLQLNAINWLLQQLLNTGALVLVVLFQPELRKGLDQIGRSRWWKKLVGESRDAQEARRTIQEIVLAMTDLSRRRVGALIVIERETGLSDIIESGTVLDAAISAPLIENVFEPNTPLHDGAMIVRGNRIVAAACILQLTEDTSVSRELGTRHRAAIGISESTDAVSLIVSEETGIMSTTRGGKLTRYLDAKSITELLTNLYLPPEEGAFKQLSKQLGRKGE
jgi:diadenylate cyclase